MKLTVKLKGINWFRRSQWRDLDGFLNFVDQAIKQTNLYLRVLKRYIRNSENSSEFYGKCQFKRE